MISRKIDVRQSSASDVRSTTVLENVEERSSIWGRFAAVFVVYAVPPERVAICRIKTGSARVD